MKIDETIMTVVMRALSTHQAYERWLDTALPHFNNETPKELMKQNRQVELLAYVQTYSSDGDFS